MEYSSESDDPPPAVRRMVASIVPYLVRMSPCMEKSITSNTDLFTFFNPSNPYHSYFQHQLSEHRNQVKKQPQDEDPPNRNYHKGKLPMGYSSDDDDPPPDVRHMVAKIVPFLVGMNPHMEKRVTSNTRLFSFFNPSDPYHSYFQHQLSEHRKQGKKQPEYEGPPKVIFFGDHPNGIYQTGLILPQYWDDDIVPSLPRSMNIIPPPPLPQSQDPPMLDHPNCNCNTGAILPHYSDIIPPPSMNMLPPPPLPQLILPPPFKEDAPSPLLDEPDPKRQRVDDSPLIPEDQFLTRHPGPVSIMVSVPNVNEGNLKGQILEIMIQSLSETIGSLKEKIAEEVQLPVNKQKLRGRAVFLKDNMSLAHYNIGAGETLTLSLRNRGGRKR